LIYAFSRTHAGTGYTSFNSIFSSSPIAVYDLPPLLC
jgi:hypothetical protein